tara:strand:- start:753 stop:926 length:174 start_codon:yes stop_codon:yes gene_type:complete
MRDFLIWLMDSTIEQIREQIDQDLSTAHKLSSYELGVMQSRINQMVNAIIRKGENNE